MEVFSWKLFSVFKEPGSEHEPAQFQTWVYWGSWEVLAIAVNLAVHILLAGRSWPLDGRPSVESCQLHNHVWLCRTEVSQVDPGPRAAENLYHLEVVSERYRRLNLRVFRSIPSWILWAHILFVLEVRSAMVLPKSICKLSKVVWEFVSGE